MYITEQITFNRLTTHVIVHLMFTLNLLSLSVCIAKKSIKDQWDFYFEAWERKSYWLCLAWLFSGQGKDFWLPSVIKCTDAASIKTSIPLPVSQMVSSGSVVESITLDLSEWDTEVKVIESS